MNYDSDIEVLDEITQPQDVEAGSSMVISSDIGPSTPRVSDVTMKTITGSTKATDVSRRSEVWDHFRKVENAGICNYCE
jgi:hypothetical protein